MTEKWMKSIILRIVIGTAYHKLVFDSNGEPTDLIFLEADPAFETITGLESGRCAGKQVTEIFGGERSKDFDWAAFYCEALRADLAGETIRYAEIHGGWYKIVAFSPDREQLIVLLQDMGQELRHLKELERQKKELEASVADLETIFESTQDAMFVARYDQGEFRYLKNNRIHQKLTGLKEVAGRTPEELLGAETGGAVRENFLRCIETGEGISYEETLDLGGGKRDWLTNLNPVRVEGEIRYLVGSRTDVTEVRHLRKDKEELLQRLESMFRDHTAAMLVINPETGRIIDANPSACDFYGYDRDELLALSIQDINMLPEEEVRRRRMMAYAESQRYFLFPHKLKSGEIRMVDVYSCPVTYGSRTELFSIIFDATDREKYRNALYREKELLSITLHSIGDGVITTDNQGRVTALNKAAVEITGWEEKEAENRSFDEIIRLRSEETGKEVTNPISIVLKSGKIVGLANHTVLIRKDGRSVAIDDSAAPIRNEAGRSFGVVMVFRDVSRDKEQQKQILFLSYHDPLTGLHNRRFLEEQMKLLDTEQQLPLGVIMGDVNGLKITNDVFGHEMGDKLLQKVAETLRETCRKGDIIARWGGDEFLILLPRTNLAEAEEIIERARSVFAEKSSGTLPLSVSLGCSVKERMEEDLQRALRQAEEWMYHQKLLEGSSYRNTIINTLLATLYEKSMETEEHAERLKGHCQAVGKRLKLNAEELNELSLLAVLHDIGKVGIPQNILQKPGPLTPEEWEEMKRHSEIGYRIAQNAPELSVVSDYILSHHEHWDGQGYPRKLKGETIPLLCRILAVSDAYDAMTNDRVYRKALSKEDAAAELMRNAGTQFDPKVVDLFLLTLSESRLDKAGRSEGPRGGVGKR